MLHRPELPEDFIMGTATASYQVEGAGKEDGRTPCIWDEFAKVPGAVYREQDGTVAVDQYHRYKEDVALMASLGFSCYRFSVSWSRVLPHDGDAVNPKGIAYYRDLCDELHKHGMKACCTVYHWDLPVELQREGGWANRRTAYRLAHLAGVLFSELGDKVDMWITINESLCVSYFGYYTGWHAPGIRDTQQFVNAVHHLNLAHGLMVAAYRKTGLTAPIGITHNLETPRPATKRPEDRLACEQYTAVKSGMFLEPQFRKRYPDYVVHGLGWKIPVEEGDMDLIAQKTDFLGINYYNEYVIEWSETADFNAGGVPRWEEHTSGIDWAVSPAGLLRQLRWLRAYTGDLPIFITENGIACRDVLTEDGRVHDEERIRYLAAHLDVCAAAVKEGIPLKGWFCWSFIDNFEWTYGYVPRFGIVYCDYETLRRYPKDSAYYLRDVMAGYGEL